MSEAPPIKIFVDSSSDGWRAAFAALIVEDGVKPRLIYGSAWHVSFGVVEAWGIKRAMRRVNAAHKGVRPIIVFTDDQRLVLSRLGGGIRYCWLPRTDDVMRFLHKVANGVRRSMPRRHPADIQPGSRVIS